MNPRKSRYYTYVRPIMRNKFAKTYSSLIFSLITISIFSYYAIRPTVTTILSLQKSIVEQNLIVKTLDKKVADLVAGKQNLDNIPQPVQTKLKNLIPSNPALPQLINSLSFAIDDAEATISGIQFQPVVLETKVLPASKSATLQEVPFTMNVQGDFPNLMEVLTILKRLDRLVSVTSINFTRPPESELMMTVAGKAYFIKN